MNCIYFFGMSRGGSSICFQVLKDLLVDWFDKHLDKEGQAYESEIDVKNLTALYEREADSSQANLLLGPYRKTEKAYADCFLDIFDNNTSKVIILTRDPADCIYSWFHAAKLHKKSNWSDFDFTNIDTFVATFTKNYYSECMGLMDIATKTNALVLDYASIVRSPVSFISQVMLYLNINASKSAVNTASNLMSFLSPYENIGSHRRSGVPGSARNRLSKEAIDRIDNTFKDFNDYFNYPSPEIPESEMIILREISSIRDSLTELMTKYALLEEEVHGKM